MSGSELVSKLRRQLHRSITLPSGWGWAAPNAAFLPLDFHADIVDKACQAELNKKAITLKIPSGVFRFRFAQGIRI